MKTKLIHLIGDPKENLYQLGLSEKEGFHLLQERVSLILSSNNFLRYGQDILSRVRQILSKSTETFFDECIKAYAEGLGIEVRDYLSFIAQFELAAHYGQIFPELKALLPGCTSMFEKHNEGFLHNRLIDFPLMGTFNSSPRLYYWKIPGKPAILNYSCVGMAPLFFQTVHESGFSMALHHKPGENYHKDGDSIFKITFDGLFEAPNMNEFRRELRKKISITKWGYYLMDNTGQVMCTDIDGSAINFESYHLNESSPLIFTNIPIHSDAKSFENYFRFCHDREQWLKDKLNKKKALHSLDLLTDVTDQKQRKWIHPTATLSTIAAYQVNLTKGLIHVKESEGAVTMSDGIFEFNLANDDSPKLVKSSSKPDTFEQAWKHASMAQSSYDQADYDQAFHHLQMAQALMPLSIWKDIFSFYLNVWNFKFINNKKELALVYREVKNLSVPPILKDQWLFLIMRLEKRLGLVLTVDSQQLSSTAQIEFHKEIEAPLPVFNTWMKLLYPRIEILDVFTPHQR